MIDRLQKQRTRGVRAFAAGFFVFFEENGFPRRWPSPAQNDNLGMCIYGSSI